MLNIVYDLKDIVFQGRGWERYGIGLLNALLERKDVKIDYALQNYRRIKKYYPQLFRRKDTEILEVVSWPEGNDRLRYAFIDERDIYHSLKEFPEFFNLKAKLMTSIHDISFTLFPHLGNNDFADLMTENLRYVLNHSEGIVCSSEVTENRVKAFMGKDGLQNKRIQFFAIEHGIDRCFSPSNLKNISEYLIASKINKPYILHIGGLEPDKNAESLIQAFQADSELRENYELIFAGPLQGASRVLAQSIIDSNLPWMRYLGFVTNRDLILLYGGAELYVSASLDEGFGHCPLEALACGTPVLCSDIPCFREILAEGAMYFDPCNVEDLAQSLKRLLSDRALRQLILENGRKQLGKYSWNLAARRTVEAYRKILSSNTNQNVSAKDLAEVVTIS